MTHIYNKVKSVATWLSLCLCACLPMFTSCSEEDDTKEEYPGWQSKNDTYWNNLYAEAKAKQEGGDASWKVIPSYAYSTMPASQLQAANCIVVHVNEKGTGEGVPLAKDTVRVHYRGHLLPSTTYTDGFQFDSSWYGELSKESAIPAKLSVSGLVDGFQTALQQMHIGDDWDVYIPYQLGYGTSQNTTASIPAYSTLIFRIILVDYWHPGEKRPAYYAKGNRME